jgi:glycosyltransferase involved in cell wall biosynthesis
MTSNNETTVAMLLSCDTFESFFGQVLQLDRDTYLKHYRNDFAWYYAKGLIENGIKPIIYVPSVRYDGIYDTDVGVKVRFLRCSIWYGPLALFRRAMRATRWTLYCQERVNAAALLGSLNRSIKDDQIDLLYIQEYWGGRYDHLSCRVQVPITAADHGGVATGVVKWFKHRSFPRAQILYCQSQDECMQVQRYSGRVMLQPNGADTVFFTPPHTSLERKKTILTVARLTDKQKRTSDLIRAMCHITPDWQLEIIGTGPDQESLTSLARKLGVDSRVHFLGFKSRAEVRFAMQTCGVYAMPSANEAMCLALLEAMCCGASIVASRIRTFESLVLDGVNGKLFPVGDVMALAEAIEEAWDSKLVRGAAAFESVSSQFDSKKLYFQLADSMRSMVRHAASEPTNGTYKTAVV